MAVEMNFTSTLPQRSHLLSACANSVSGANTSANAFPLGDPLSSIDSATGVPVLFAHFAGTMGPSDFLLAFMSAVPSETFSNRFVSPAGTARPFDEDQQDLPVLALATSTRAQGLRLRRAQSRLALGGAPGVAFPLSVQGRHAKLMISELNGWPASPLADATPAMSPSPAYGPRPELLAGFSL